jgi:hypothetical protein
MVISFESVGRGLTTGRAGLGLCQRWAGQREREAECEDAEFVTRNQSAGCNLSLPRDCPAAADALA